ncbi:MAG: class I SAM-dependent methyltransferase [Mycobacterium sp.]|jgi:SAM-dependent methyltransferase|uniref:methyltransferase domain-containing protein n=1 Tax=Mycobacterium TaxID=1763 RepID=UPI0009F234FB|nr:MULTISPECIES: methyltransferase domain-containing protein [Mycobacterium]MBI2699031.1 methyltransferase domain-containing protein [Mycobacterium sp.]MBX9980438.1 class I SAM-dependent methyltransferase [Mycobacterium gordonae]PJE09400.1 MAG: class I SAM-dependent methyltransferase [Mycobacterium sp.]PJE10375.1 MAG: class I SAM-dependent methyltransferase [Mycobacterium sp.]
MTAWDLERFIRSAMFRGPGRCNLCDKKVRFKSISRTLGRTLAQYQFPYALDDFETLNHRRYLCPVCGCSDRDRLYKLYVDRFLPPDGVRRVVEFAPAPALSAYLRSRDDFHYRSADLMMSGVDDVVDITNMPNYQNDSLDFFICSHVLEHVTDDGRALDELYRVLVPGGRGIIMTPVTPQGSFDEDPSLTDERERWRRFAQGDHVRLYDRATLCSRIRQHRFEIDVLDWRSFGQEAFSRHAIDPGSVLYVVQKPSQIDV